MLRSVSDTDLEADEVEPALAVAVNIDIKRQGTT